MRSFLQPSTPSLWMPNKRDFFVNLGLASGLVASLAFAGESALSLLNAGMPAG